MAKNKQPKLNHTQLAKLRMKELCQLLPGGKLTTGSHARPEEGVCFMEAVAWVTGEPHSDHPECACPILTDITIDANDSMSDVDRQRLIEAIPALVGSKTSSKRVRFKRCVCAARIVLHSILSEMKPRSWSKTTNNAVARYVFLRLDSLQGRPITKRLIREMIDLFGYLSEANYEIECDVIPFLELLHKYWDSKGITFMEYASIMGSAEFSSMIRSNDQFPNLLIELATQRA